MTSPHTADRRARFLEMIGDAVAVIPAAHESPRNDDVDYEFRQDSAFFFLTAFPEPDAVAVFNPSHRSERFVLFVRPRDREMEIWNGYRAGVEGARQSYGADAAYPIDDLESKLKEYLVGSPALFYRAGHRRDEQIQGLLAHLRPLEERFGYVIPHSITDPTPILDDLRLRKTSAEVDLLRRACDISAAGHQEAMRFARPGLFEYRVQAAMEFVFRQHGSTRNGYPSIVASGANATVLHYTENDRRIEDGDLLLIDAGAEYGYFSSDITRTFPANGTFSGPQRAVYEVVLAAQRAAIEVCRFGSNLRLVHDTATRVLTEGLVELGLLPRGVEDSLAMHHYREFFMHGTSHWLGMDVHDAGTYKVNGEHRELEAGMAFTVEPGLYVDRQAETVSLALLEYDLDAWTERRIRLGTAKARELEAKEKEEAGSIEHPVPLELRGIGIRIEDDLLVTDDGCENLTAAVPVLPDEVEAMVRETSRLPEFA